MRSSDLARVGLAVVLGLAIFVGAVFWLRGNAAQGRSYLLRVKFADAQGIQKAGYVRAAGVNVGEVASVGLGTDPKLPALVTLRISNTYRVQPTDSIRIVSGLVGFSPPYVEITPGALKEAVQAGPDGAIPGQSPGGTERLISEADRLLNNLNKLSTSMTKLATSLSDITSDPKLRTSLVKTAGNFEKVSDSGVRIARNLENASDRADRLFHNFQATAANLNSTLKRADVVLGTFQGTAVESRALMRDARDVMQDTRGVVAQTGEVVKNTNETVKNAGGLVTDARAAINENREKLKGVFDSLNVSLKQLDTTLAEAKSFIADPALRTNLQQTSENVRDATANLKKITVDVQGLTGDPKVQEDLRATISGLRDATEQAADVFARVRQVLGSGGRTAKSIGQRISDARLDASLVGGDDRTRIDFDATIPWSDTVYYRLGLFDFGEGNKFNAQRGQRLNSSFWGRYGVHASTIGLGLDIGNSARPAFTADLFGIDSPRLDLHANLPISRYFDLTAGVNDLFDRSDPVFGVRFRR